MRSTTRLVACLLIAAMPSLASAAGADAADAAERKDMAALRAMVTKRVNVNTPQADGTTALLWAAHWNDVETVKLLLRAGANAVATNRFGASPLSEAAISGNAELVKALLEAGADAKALSTPDGETVLMSAARSGNLDSVRMLLDRGADVNARERYKGQTALMWAAAERHAPVVKLLLERGADWKIRGFDRETKPPKLSAASAISPIPRGGFTALMFTARDGDVESARIMLDAGVDINHGDVDNVTPLVTAIMNKQYTLSRFLIDRGADVNIADAGGRTALYAMIDIRNEDWTAMPNRTTDDPLPTIEVVKALIDHGANLEVPLTRPLTVRSGMDFGDTTLGDGATPMMRAARAGDHEVIRLLLAKGANATLTTKDGSTALMFAAGIGYRDKNTRGSESDALETVKVMMAAGLDLKQTNNRGENALHGAALRGADTIVKFLVDQGMDVNALSKQGYTPLDVAMGKTIVLQLPVPQESTVALLKKLGGKEGPGPRSARPPAAP
ncbi:MAG TPA: ankyrin repeat domain-containing protein [Vicinamibacterales bacterium]|nr:ankyrin repeat domain-containing protein [Vicinamibacterales bacterium]